MIIGCAHNVGSDKSRKRELYGGIPYAYPPSNTSGNRNFKSLISEYDSEGNVYALIDNYYSDFIYEDKYNELKNKLTNKTLRMLKKVSNSLAQMEQKLLSDEKSDKYRLYGDLLMANLYQLEDFLSAAQVFDYENNTEISIPLDSEKTVKENANRYYKLYNKSKNVNIRIPIIIKCSKYNQCILRGYNCKKNVLRIYDVKKWFS